MEGDHWKGDWPAFGGVARIIGMYVAINANTENLGASSVKSPEDRNSEYRRGLKRCMKGKPTRDRWGR